MWPGRQNLSLLCKLREFLIPVSFLKHFGHNEFHFEAVSSAGASGEGIMYDRRERSAVVRSSAFESRLGDLSGLGSE